LVSGRNWCRFLFLRAGAGTRLGDQGTDVFPIIPPDFGPPGAGSIRPVGETLPVAATAATIAAWNVRCGWLCSMVSSRGGYNAGVEPASVDPTEPRKVSWNEA
jgi:hypothetical protein